MSPLRTLPHARSLTQSQALRAAGVVSRALLTHAHSLRFLPEALRSSQGNIRYSLGRI